MLMQLNGCPLKIELAVNLPPQSSAAAAASAAASLHIKYSAHFCMHVHLPPFNLAPFTRSPRVFRTLTQFALFCVFILHTFLHYAAAVCRLLLLLLLLFFVFSLHAMSNALSNGIVIIALVFLHVLLFFMHAFAS